MNNTRLPNLQAAGVRVPQIKDIKRALTLYYECTELTSQDIMYLFNCSKSKAQKLKNYAKNKQIEAGICFWSACNINTKNAFEAWGLDIEDLKARLEALKKLKVI